MNKKKIFLSTLIFVFLFLIILDPKTNINACLNGISLWTTAVLPALFPFLLLTSLLNTLGTVKYLGKVFSPMTKALFKTDGLAGYVYAISVISGYPVGAKTTAELYENGYISKGQAIKITTFSSTSGPLFIIGTVGVTMFCSSKLGLLIFLCHILGSLLNGILYRNAYNEKTVVNKIYTFSSNNVLEEIMYNSIKSILIVGGYIAIFCMIISMLDKYNVFSPLAKIVSLIFGTSKAETVGVLSGLIEVTNGLKKLSQLGLSMKKALVLSTGLISFGGFSIHLQSITFLKRFDMPLGFYFKSKLTQTFLSIAVAIIVALFI